MSKRPYWWRNQRKDSDNYLSDTLGVTPVTRIEPDPQYQGEELLTEKVLRDPQERKRKNFRTGDRKHRGHRCHDNCAKCLPKMSKKLVRGTRAYQEMLEE